MVKRGGGELRTFKGLINTRWKQVDNKSGGLFVWSVSHELIGA